MVILSQGEVERKWTLCQVVGAINFAPLTQGSLNEGCAADEPIDFNTSCGFV